MKTSSILIPCVSIVIAAIVASHPPSARAKIDPITVGNNQVVVLHAYEDGYGQVDEIDGTNRYTYYNNGIVIGCSSSSPGAPQFPQDSIPRRETIMSLAPGMAQLFDQGYELVNSFHMGGMTEYIFRKRQTLY